MSADSFAGSRIDPQTLNLYSYTGNNPLRFVDPTGHYSVDIERAKKDDQQKPKPDGGDAPPCWPKCGLYPGQAPVINETVTVAAGDSSTITTTSPDMSISLYLQGTGGDTNPSEPPYNPDTRVAKDNDDFRQVNLSISPKVLVGAGVHFAFTWDKYGGHYFSVGPTVGLGLPISGSLVTGQTIREGAHVRDRSSVENILSGPSGNANFCPIVCMNGSWNISKFSFFVGPPVPKGGGTMGMGLGVPELSTGKDWSWKLPF